MNTLFRNILLISSFVLIPCIEAREIILVDNLAAQEDGEMVTRILKEKFNIPESFIRVKQKSSCKLNHDAIMHLCLRTSGELDVLKIENYAIENMLRVFLEMEK